MTYKPVFLEIPVGEDGFAKGGRMSLRDYFAANAMQSLFCASSDNGRFTDSKTLEKVAAVSYQMADAMLSERDK